MTLTVHHLGISQSERIVWLCEELGLDYVLVTHSRDPVLAPASLKSFPGNTTGKSPFIIDDFASPPITLSESGAISDYIIGTYGEGKLQIKAGENRFADYLYWFHYANGSLQPAMLTSMFLGAATETPEDGMIKTLDRQRLHASLKLIDDRLASNKWLAGEQFTAADIMSVYPLTTQRYFGPQVSLAPYKNILRWLKDCAARPAFQKAMEKGDPEMEVLLHAEAPSMGLMAAGGSGSDIWKKKKA